MCIIYSSDIDGQSCIFLFEYRALWLHDWGRAGRDRHQWHGPCRVSARGIRYITLLYICVQYQCPFNVIAI